MRGSEFDAEPRLGESDERRARAALECTQAALEAAWRAYDACPGSAAIEEVQARLADRDSAHDAHERAASRLEYQAWVHELTRFLACEPDAAPQGSQGAGHEGTTVW